MKKLRNLFLVTMLLSILCVSGCHKEKKAEKDVADFMQRTEKMAQAKKYDQDKKEKPIISYRYTGDNLRDPFDRSENVVSAKRHDNSILSEVSLDNLKLVGTVVRSENSWAIVRAPDGKLYHLKQGVHVGVQQAMVSDIRQSEVILKVEPEVGSKEKAQAIVMKVQE